MNTRSRNRAFILVLCICFALLLIISNVFVLTHAGHVHNTNGIGGNCSMCAYIADFQELIKNLLNGCLPLFAFLSLFIFISRFSFHAISRAGFAAPVYLKVRLNN